MNWIWWLVFAAFLFVTKAKLDPVLSHECISTRYRNLTCEMQMAADSSELLVWGVTFTTRELRNCGASACKNAPCKNSALSTNGKLVCRIIGWVFEFMTYDISVVDETLNGTEIISTFPVVLDYTILKLGPPTILGNKTDRFTLSVHVQLYEEDMLSKSVYGVHGFIEMDVKDQGVIYHVTAYTKEHANKVTETFVDKNTDSWLAISDLQPNTQYSIDIKTQINGTHNPDVWSDVTSLMLLTQMSNPAAAPEHSPFGFTITSSSECKQGRTITLFWKALSAKGGRGNGEITSYNIYKYTLQLTPEQDTTAMRRLTRGSPQIIIRGKDLTSAEVCVGEESYEVNVVPSNSAGLGQQAAIYYIPKKSHAVNVRPCDISITYGTSSDTLTVSWSNLPQEYVTVFWCEPDTNNSCTNEKVSWSETVEGNNFNIEGWQRTSSEHVWPSGYKFGVSVHTSTYISSGIVWMECISYLEEEMVAAAVDVKLYGLRGQVTLIDSCDVGRRSADSYLLMSCGYDVKGSACVGDITVTSIDLCSKSTTVSLHKYNTDYAFWVESRADGLSVKSRVVIKRTDNKEWTWELVVVILLVLFSAAISTLGLFYCNRQRKIAQMFKDPKLVTPTAAPLIEPLPEKNGAEEDQSSPYILCAVSGQQSQYAAPSSVKAADSGKKMDDALPPITNSQSATTSCSGLSFSYVVCNEISALPWNAQWLVEDNSTSADLDDSQCADMPTPSTDWSEEVATQTLSDSTDYQLLAESSTSTPSKDNSK